MTKNKTVLIIEDEPSQLELLAETFEEIGLIVILAHNGEEGWKFAQKEKPDLIILDILMPKIDGITLLKKLRQEPWGQAIPVIILTNLSTTETINVAQQQKVNEYLIKTDWKIEDVVKKVKRILNMV